MLFSLFPSFDLVWHRSEFVLLSAFLLLCFLKRVLCLFSRLTQQGEPVSCQWSRVPGSGCVHPHEQSVRWSPRLHRWLGWRASLQRWWTHRNMSTSWAHVFCRTDSIVIFSRVKSVGFCRGLRNDQPRFSSLVSACLPVQNYNLYPIISIRPFNELACSALCNYNGISLSGEKSH